MIGFDAMEENSLALPRRQGLLQSQEGGEGEQENAIWSAHQSQNAKIRDIRRNIGKPPPAGRAQAILWLKTYLDQRNQAAEIPVFSQPIVIPDRRSQHHPEREQVGQEPHAHCGLRCHSSSHF